MTMLGALCRAIVDDVRRRLRQIRECPPCYKIGFESVDPPSVDDIITAPEGDEEWVDHTTFAVYHRLDNGSHERIDLRNEDEEDRDDPLDLREVN